MNEVQIDITDINISYTHLYADSTPKAIKAFGVLTVNYTALFQDVYETKGTMIINEGDQDTHNHIEHLAINDLQFIIANRLGVYKDSGDDDNA